MTTQTTAPPGQFELPLIVTGPWTHAARQLAIDKECLQHFIDYFGKAMKTRRWSPWHDLPIEEMKKFGQRLTQETINLIEGFLGIEEYVGDYVEEGLEMFRNNRMRRNLQLQWGSEELKHGVAWENVLLHSGARTEEQLRDLLRQSAGASLDDQESRRGRQPAGRHRVRDGAGTRHVLQLSGNARPHPQRIRLARQPDRRRTRRAATKSARRKRFASSAWTRSPITASSCKSC